MQPFNRYITGRSDGIDPAELGRLIDRYEWFSTARRARAALTGKADLRLTLALVFWPTIQPENTPVPEAGCVSAEDALERQTGCVSAEDRLIERFLLRGGYRIVPADAPDAEIPDETSCGSDSDDVLPTQELAEIYRSQGLFDEADEIYRRLNMK